MAGLHKFDVHEGQRASEGARENRAAKHGMRHKMTSSMGRDRNVQRRPSGKKAALSQAPGRMRRAIQPGRLEATASGLGAADQTLTKIAESAVNRMALRRGPFLYRGTRLAIIAYVPPASVDEHLYQPNLTPMKSRYPKNLEERQRILEVFRGLKTARSAQAYVRGNTEHYYR
jgi:hypothetical protein